VVIEVPDAMEWLPFQHSEMDITDEDIKWPGNCITLTPDEDEE
jgi:hypothetical protein